MAASLVVGLTGNIATGKSAVLAYLAAKGAHIVDADALAHRAMAVGEPAHSQIVAAFGPAIQTPDGQIDRRRLGQIVFAEPTALRRLEAIVHPQVFALARQEIAATQAPVVILEAIKLLESGLTVTLCDRIWVVTAPVAQQLARLQQSRGMDLAEAQRRMAAQSSQAEKAARADRVIRNDGSLADLHRQLDQLWQELFTDAALASHDGNRDVDNDADRDGEGKANLA